MIVVLKYNKSGSMKYISHIDLLRHFTRAFRRAGLALEYSEGFNPHMLINLGTPLPLGISSSAEYITVRTVDADGETFMKKYNAVAPAGLEATKAFTLGSNPNLAGRTVAADYAVKQVGADKVRREVEGVVNLISLEMPITKKGETTVKDVAPMVNGVKIYPDSLNVCLAAGNTTLRPDRFTEFLAEKYGFIVKTAELWKYEQYVREGGVLLETDAYLERLSVKEEKGSEV